jgi:anti-sigma factor RsiW
MTKHPVSDNALFAYALGDADLPDRATIAAHVDACPACAARLARIELVRTTVQVDAALRPSPAALTRVKALAAVRVRAAEPERESSLLASLRRLAAALTFDSRAAPALAGLRGATDGYVLAFATDELDVDLQIEPVGGMEGARWRLTGQIDTAIPTVVVALAEPGSVRPLFSAAVESDGMFEFEIAGGTYDLLVQLAEAVVVVPNLEVG